MSTTLRGASPKDTFGDLLHMSNAGIGADATARSVSDGSGNTLPIHISTDSIGLDRVSTYKMKAADSTGVLDLSIANVFRVSASTNRTISFTNVPGSTTSMTVLVVISGATGAFTWPGSVLWSAGASPTLGANKTVVTLLWDGVSWVGATSIKA